MSRPRKAVVEYRIYELSKQFPILLLDGENWHISDVKNNRLHFHNCFEIGICHTDSGTMIFEDTEFPFSAGTITCIPKQIAHTTYSSKGTKSLWSYLFLDFHHFFGNAFFQEKFYEYDNLQNFDFYMLFDKDKNPHIYFYIINIIEELKEKKSGYEVVVHTLLNILYCYLLRAKINQKHKGNIKDSNVYPLALALNYIDENYSKTISTEELAVMCNLSTTHFRRVFNSVMGYSPHSFVNKVRIENACDLLLTTTESVISIAESVGFLSISSFNRCFHQMTGTSPRAYRNSRGVEENPKIRCVLPYSGWTKAEDLSLFSQNQFNKNN